MVQGLFELLEYSDVYVECADKYRCVVLVS